MGGGRSCRICSLPGNILPYPCWEQALSIFSFSRLFGSSSPVALSLMSTYSLTKLESQTPEKKILRQESEIFTLSAMLRGWVAHPRFALILQGIESWNCSSFSIVDMSGELLGELRRWDSRGTRFLSSPLCTKDCSNTIQIRDFKGTEFTYKKNKACCAREWTRNMILKLFFFLLGW